MNQANDPKTYTLINVFSVAPENQQALADTLIATTEGWVKKMPGFISATIYKSLDGTKVANYAQAAWSEKEFFEKLGADPEIRQRMNMAMQLGKPEGAFYIAEKTITA